jgi:hypothetical protein
LVGSLYYKNWVDLEKNKEKVFAEGYSTIWEADFNAHGVEKQDVINSKDICKYLIFPKASDDLRALQRVFGYLNVKMTDEATHLFQSRAKRTIQSFTEFCKEQIEIVGAVSLLFSS